MVRRDNRRAILQTAEKLFLTRRFDQVTLDEVSRKARVGKGTIYLHFQDKEDLYAQVFVSGLEELEDILESVVAANNGPQEKLQEIANVLRAFYDKRRTLFRLGSIHEFRRVLKNRSPNVKLSERQSAVLELITKAISEGQSQGMYRRDIDPRAATRLFMAMLRDGYFSKTETNGCPVEVDTVIQVFTNGIRQ